jgi:ABC-type nitrate/sulfonate/bicarbonate transport system substrate-binding protein
VIGTSHAFAIDKPKIPTVPEKKIVFVYSHFADYTTPVIAEKKGWLKEIGITIQDVKVAPIAQCVDLLIAGSGDVVVSTLPLYAPRLPQIPNVRLFALVDLFTGWGIMVPEKANYLSYHEFLKRGLSPDEAIKMTVEQLKGKKYLLPAQPGIKNFVTMVLEKGGINIGKDVEIVYLSPEQHVAAMKSGRYDVETDGAPVRVALTKHGYTSILDAVDLGRAGSPTRASKELRLLPINGWTATSEWIEANYDTALRLTGLCIRINEFIEDPTTRREAAQMQVPYLNSITGTDMDIEGMLTIYNELNDFLTYNEQFEFFFNRNKAFYYEYVYGSQIDQWVETGVFKKGQFEIQDVEMAAKLFKDLVNYQIQADKFISEVEGELQKKGGKEQDLNQAKDLLDRGIQFYKRYDFLDAWRFAKAASEWVNYARR